MARILGFLLFLCFAASVNAEPFQGDFISVPEGEGVFLTLNRDARGQYVGSMRMQGEVLSIVAQRQAQAQELVGVAGDVYPFVAYMDGDLLVFDFDDGESLAFQSTSQVSSRAPTTTGSRSSAPPAQGMATQREVYINRVRLGTAQLQQLEGTYQTHIENGRYWYDALCGAWGVEGGPTAGFIMAGLGLPGPMPADISGGGTGIFINGREIHPLDQRGLQYLFGITYQGRYWLDASGNLGTEGGPAIVNIVSAIQNAQRQQGGGSVTHGYGSGGGARGTVGGGMYSGTTASGKSVFWYPGM